MGRIPRANEKKWVMRIQGQMEVMFEALVEPYWRDALNVAVGGRLDMSAATVSHEAPKRPARRDLRDKGDRG
jgi:hypothetical protein